MKRTENDLAACLDELKAGNLTLEECLEKYPDASGELESLVRLALKVDRLPAVRPSAAFKARARASIVEYAHDNPVKHAGWWSPLAVLTRPGLARVGIIVIAALLIISGAGTGTAYASQSSLPGDVLYTVKTGTESWRTWIEGDPAVESSLEIEFADRRVWEMEQLVNRSSQAVSIAVSGYESNLEKAIANASEAAGTGPLEDMAFTIEGQLTALDRLENAAGATTQNSIGQAEQIAVTVQLRALERLSDADPLRACELTITAMQNRLNRASGIYSNGNTIRAENALRQFVMYAEFGNNFEDQYAGTATGETIEALFRQAVRNQEQLFNSFSGQVSAGLENEVNTALRRMERNRGEEPGGRGPGQGSQGTGMESPVQTPADQVQEPEGDQAQQSGISDQTFAGTVQEPGISQSTGPGNQTQAPPDQGQTTATTDPAGDQPQEQDGQGPDSGGQGQGSGQGGGSGSGGQAGR